MNFKQLALLFMLFFVYLICAPQVWASEYVLPYPGIMPGHKLYRLEQAIDYLNQYWSFGNFSHHQYELKLADKKLIEAKTLFEYKQYLLAVKALSESNKHFLEASLYLRKAGDEGKDITVKMANLTAAAEKHVQILQELGEKQPEEFLWQPEEGTATHLFLRAAIMEAIKGREI